MSDNGKFYCEEGCGLTVNQDGGTCLACWAKIDADKGFQLTEKKPIPATKKVA